jgi:hypothetical protein
MCLEAQLAHFATNASNQFYIDNINTPHILRIANVNVSGGTIDPLFESRPVTVGDVAYVTAGSSPVKRRKVVSLLGIPVPSSYGANANANDNNIGNGALNPATHTPTSGDVTTNVPAGYTLAVTNPSAFQALVKGSILKGKYGDGFYLTVVTGGAAGTASFSVSSASGLWNSAAPIVSTNPSGSIFQITDASLAGLTVQITPSSPTTVATGQVFYFECYGAYAQLGAAQLIASDTGAGYTGPVNTTYMVQVVTGSASFSGAVLRISDTAGVDTIQTAVTETNETNFTVGSYGLRMQFSNETPVAQVGLRTGDVYFIKAVAPSVSTTQFNRIVLDGPAADLTLFTNVGLAVDVNFVLPWSGQILSTAAAGGTAWTASSNGVALVSGLSLFVSARSSGEQWCAFNNAVGTVAVSFRALVPPAAGEGLIAINVESDLAQLGTVALANDLAQGASNCFTGSQGQMVYCLRTTGIGVADFTAALQKVQATNQVYALAPLTTDQAVMTAVVQHCDSMSQPSVKNFRRCYVGTDSPGSYPTTVYNATNVAAFTCTVAAQDGANVLVSTDDAIDFTQLNLSAGDIFKLPTLSELYLIASVLSPTQLLLQSGPDATIPTATGFQLWYADTPTSQSNFIVARNAAFADRRCANIWCENGTATNEGTVQVIPSRFVAAEIAGLRCAVLPQQGLTLTEITSITNAPAMWERYSATQLDTIAASGTFIITQDVASGAVYIRHQLTTQTNEGNLYYEDSVGVNFDNIALGFNAILNPYRGKTNVVQSTLNDIRTQCSNFLNTQTQSTVALASSNLNVGPPLISWNTLSVAAGPLLDSINASVGLELPLPLNTINLTLFGSVATGLVAATASGSTPTTNS